MNPDYLWLADTMQLLSVFIVGPLLAVAIAYAAWRGKLPGFTTKRYGILCVASGVISVLLLGFAKWLNADIRTVQYFLQLVCVLLGGLLFGVCVGCGFPVLLALWHWHRTTATISTTERTDR